MYTILGATGNIGSKIADIMIKDGENVRLVARTAERLSPFVRRGAKAVAGDALDPEFLTRTFKGAKAVFTLIPPNYQAEDFSAYADAIGESIAKAIGAAGVKHVVNLSSIGAELPEGNGLIRGLHRQEKRLSRIPGLNVIHLRAAYFMENLLWGIDPISNIGVNGSALRGDLKIPMVATKDIAHTAVHYLLTRDFKGSTVHYLLGPRDLTLKEATGIIGRTIGRPDLSYVLFPYEEAEKGLAAEGFSPDVTKHYLEMVKAFNDGTIRSVPRRAEYTTPTPIEAFCDEVFAPAYHQAKAA